MQYFKLFDKHEDYETYMSSEGKYLPNLSYCIDAEDVHFTFAPEKRLIVYYNITSISEPTQIYAYNTDSFSNPIIGVNMFNKIEIDDIEVSITDLDNNSGQFQFQTTGEHIIKYTLKNPTMLGADIDDITNPGSTFNYGAMFINCQQLINVEIPNSVTSLLYGAFVITNLNTLNISKYITNINYNSCIWTQLNYINVDPENTIYDSRNNCNGVIETSTNKLILGSNHTTFPNTLITIGQDACSERNFSSIFIIPDSVTLIEDRAFQNCNYVYNPGTFYGDIILGSGITEIGEYAFSGTYINNITINAITPPTIASNTFDLAIMEDTKIYVSAESVNAYKTATNWSNYAEYIFAIS